MRLSPGIIGGAFTFDERFGLNLLRWQEVAVCQGITGLLQRKPVSVAAANHVDGLIHLLTVKTQCAQRL